MAHYRITVDVDTGTMPSREAERWAVDLVRGALDRADFPPGTARVAAIDFDATPYIQAIKAVRELTGAGLKDAKAACEATRFDVPSAVAAIERERLRPEATKALPGRAYPADALPWPQTGARLLSINETPPDGWVIASTGDGREVVIVPAGTL